MSESSSPNQDTLEPARPENSLPGFPTEIIIRITISMASFQTAIALSKTSRRFQSSWQTQMAQICHAILVQTIACADHAFDYVKTQPPIHTSNIFGPLLDYFKAQPLDIAYLAEIRDKGLAIVDVTQQFCENAEIACRALEYYKHQSVWTPDGLGPGSLTPAQRILFLRAWYRIHVLATLSRKPLSREVFSSFDMLEFKQMMEVLCWLTNRCPENQRLDLQVTYRMEGKLEMLRSFIPPQRWYNLGAGLNSFSQYLIKHLHDYRWNKDVGIHFWRLLNSRGIPEQPLLEKRRQLG